MFTEENIVRAALIYLLLVAVALLVCVPFIIISGNNSKKALIQKCTSEPTLFECQLYLSEKTRAGSCSNNFASGFAGGVVGGMIAPRGR
jgi:hypothetical protein